MIHKKRSLFSKKRSRTVKRNFKKHGLLLANATVIALVTGFVWVGHNSASQGSSATLSFIGQQSSTGESAPLDTLSSADIAANVALATSMPEEVMVINQADSYKAQLTQANTEESVVAKPQVVTGASESKNDITTYVAVEGDTVTKIAAQFGVSADSIKWSNGIAIEDIPSGKELKIPPSDGIVYQVADGDTIESLAAKYRASAEKLVAVNDTELTGLKPGDTIFIAGGQPPVTPRASRTSSTAAANRSSNTAPAYNFVARYGGNGYYYGYCTWYAANRVAVPSNWGNANTWDNRARSSGWTVSKTPVPGAVAQTDAMSWWGHVAVVEAVSADGTMMKYSDMNGIAGFGRVGYSDWVPTSTFQNYIYR
ncbi:MAG: LysM peptidoglycan-binding domain-containing protein [Candidatus Saccharimonadales bacterium]|nr:LysM peptidoglycan-binding domain-containing protein [Candidatus Nomurabacteria bacterium]